MSELTARELTKFKEYLQTKFTRIEHSLNRPKWGDDHETIAKRAIANAYLEMAMSELLVEFDMDINSAIEKEKEDDN